MTEHNAPKKQKPNNKLNNYARYSGIAFQMLAVIAIGSYGGVLLDEQFPNKYSIFTIVCSLASVGIAMYFVIKQATKISDRDE